MRHQVHKPSPSVMAFVWEMHALLGHRIEQLSEGKARGGLTLRCVDCGSTTEVSGASGELGAGLDPAFRFKCPGLPMTG
ncbi:MAG: hypothetical protein GY711_15740 [bacterium]|nr:hypothetical protein [bacterium]